MIPDLEKTLSDCGSCVRICVVDFLRFANQTSQREINTMETPTTFFAPLGHGKLKLTFAVFRFGEKSVKINFRQVN